MFASFIWRSFPKTVTGEHDRLPYSYYLAFGVSYQRFAGLTELRCFSTAFPPLGRRVAMPRKRDLLQLPVGCLRHINRGVNDLWHCYQPTSRLDQVLLPDLTELVTRALRGPVVTVVVWFRVNELPRGFEIGRSCEN